MDFSKSVSLVDAKAGQRSSQASVASKGEKQVLNESVFYHQFVRTTEQGDRRQIK